MKRILAFVLSFAVLVSMFSTVTFGVAEAENVIFSYSAVKRDDSNSTVSLNIDLPQGVVIDGGIEMHIEYDTSRFTVSNITSEYSIIQSINTNSGVFNILFDGYGQEISSDTTLFTFNLNYSALLTSGKYDFPSKGIYCYKDDAVSTDIPFTYNGDIEISATEADIDFSIYPEEIELNLGESETLYTRVYPQNYDVGAVTWSSNSAIVSVNQLGKIEAIGEGIAVITATTDKGFTAQSTVTVTDMAIKSVAVTKNPDKTLYTVGEFFNADGMEIEVTYEDDSTRTVKDGWTIITSEALTSDIHTAYIEFKGYTFEVPIEVQLAHMDPNMKGISVSTLPYKVNYITQVSDSEYYSAAINGITSVDVVPDIEGLKLARIDKNDNVTNDYFDWTIEGITSGYSTLKVGTNDITVSYDNFNTTYPIFIDIVALNIMGMPKTKFSDEQEISFKGLTAQLSSAYYDFVRIPEDGENFEPVIFTHEDFNFSYKKELGKQTVTAATEYLGETLTYQFEIEIYKRELTGIEIEALPEKTDFPLGYTPDFTGLKVNAVFNDGEKMLLGEGDYQVDYSALTVGESTVTVNYEGFSETFTVNGYERVLEKIDVDTSNCILKVNTEIDFSDASVFAVYNDGYRKPLAPADCEFSPVGEFTLGEHQIEVRYTEENFTDSFSITVTEFYERNDTEIYGISPNTTAEQFCLNSNNQKYTYTVFKNGSQAAGTDIVFSGDTVKVYDKTSGELKASVTAIVLGDVNGDGVANTKDVSAIIKYITNKTDNGFYSSAADVNGDKKVDVADVVYLKRYCLDWKDYVL